MALEQAITEFRSQFQGAVIEPEDPSYEQSRKVYNGMIDRRPRLIVKCADVADVMMPASGTGEKRVMYFRHEK